MLYAVAAAVIGGASLFGGRGKPMHALLGGLVIATVFNGLDLMGITTWAPGRRNRRRAPARRHGGCDAPASRVDRRALT